MVRKPGKRRNVSLNIFYEQLPGALICAQHLLNIFWFYFSSLVSQINHGFQKTYSHPENFSLWNLCMFLCKLFHWASPQFNDHLQIFRAYVYTYI